MCCEVLEHLVHDPMHMFVECWRVLAGGGTAPHHTECGESHKSFRGHGRKAQPTGFLALSPAGNNDTPHVREYTPVEISQALQAAGFKVDVLITERMKGADHATWVLDVLSANGFDTSLRGEQIYCIARKLTPTKVERYPAFLYTL